MKLQSKLLISFGLVLIAAFSLVEILGYQQTRENNFNYWKLTLSRLKQYMLYKPLLYLYRRGVTVG